LPRRCHQAQAPDAGGDDPDRDGLHRRSVREHRPPAIQQALHADAASTQWIVTPICLLLRRAVRSEARRRSLRTPAIFLAGVAVFTAASIACGLSPNMTVPYCQPRVQGVGAALLTPASLAMLGATFDAHERSHAIGIWRGVGALTRRPARCSAGWLASIKILARDLSAQRTAGACRGRLAAGFAWRAAIRKARRSTGAAPAAVAIGLAAITWGLGALPASGFHDKTVLGALGAGAAFLISFVAIESQIPRSSDDAAVAVPLPPIFTGTTR